MNYWTKISSQYAQQRNYLDQLYKVYPITPNLRRTLPLSKEEKIKEAFSQKK